MKIKLMFENPNSLNNHWLKSRNGVFLSPKGREFRNHVIQVVTQAGYYNLKLQGRIKYTAVYCPPDRRPRDIDNFCTKAVFDALKHSGIYEDDKQIDYVQYQRGDIQEDKIGKIFIEIEEIQN